MPSKAMRPCMQPGCTRLTTERYCDQHRRPSRVGSMGYQDLYHEGAYRKARAVFMAEHPMCAECMRQGKYTLATELDHIKPHKGNRVLFYAQSNWQALCKECHDRKTASEDGGFGNAPRLRKF